MLFVIMPLFGWEHRYCAEPLTTVPLEPYGQCSASVSGLVKTKAEKDPWQSLQPVYTYVRTVGTDV